MRPLDFLGRIKVKLGIVIVLAVVTAFGVNELGILANLSGKSRIAIAVVIALIMIQLLARGMTKPLREMAAAAQTIAKGRYGLRVTATSRDEVGELARAFNAMAADLGEVDRQRRELVANVSHELRTPITGLQAVLENVVDGVSPPDVDTLGTALAQTQRLGRLVAQLLDLSRLDSGARLIEPEVLDLASFCRQAVSETGLARDDITVRSEVPPGTSLLADPDLFAQVLANLLDNAVRHSPPGGTVWLKAHGEGADIEVSVGDSGPGIAAAERSRVFERFSRLDAGRAADAGGAGLGLAIAKEIVELHGGSLRVADQPNGCLMVVLLPGRSAVGDTSQLEIAPADPTPADPADLTADLTATNPARMDSVLPASVVKGSVVRGSVLKGPVVKGSMVKGLVVKGSVRTDPTPAGAGDSAAEIPAPRADRDVADTIASGIAGSAVAQRGLPERQPLAVPHPHPPAAPGPYPSAAGYADAGNSSTARAALGAGIGMFGGFAAGLFVAFFFGLTFGGASGVVAMLLLTCLGAVVGAAVGSASGSRPAVRPVQTAPWAVRHVPDQDSIAVSSGGGERKGVDMSDPGGTITHAPDGGKDVPPVSTPQDTSEREGPRDTSDSEAQDTREGEAQDKSDSEAQDTREGVTEDTPESEAPQDKSDSGASRDTSDSEAPQDKPDGQGARPDTPTAVTRPQNLGYGPPRGVGYHPPPVYVPPPLFPRPDLPETPRWVLPSAAAVGLVAAIALPYAPMGLGLVLTAVAMGVAVLPAVLPAGLREGKRRVTPWTVALGVLAYALVSVALFRDAEWLVAPVLLAAFGIAALALSGGGVGWLGAVRGGLSVLLALLPMPWFLSVPVNRLLRRRRLMPILASVGVTVVLLLVFGLLFASADAVFSAFATKFLQAPEWASSLPLRIFLFAVFVVLAAAAVLVGLRPVAEPEGPDLHMRVARTLWVIPLLGLNLLFAAFVAVQITVLFGGNRRVLSTSGLTYAEYARSGFFELVTVSVFVLGIVAAAVLLVSLRERADRWIMAGLLGLLCAFTLVILFSAVHRLGLYIDAYGMSQLRASVGAAIWWLGAVFVLVLVAGAVRLARRGTSWFPRTLVLITGVSLLAFAGWNPDVRVAESQFAVRGLDRMDQDYLGHLGAEAVPVLDRLPEPARSCVLREVIAVNELAEPDPWNGWNLARAQARAVLDRHPLVMSASCDGTAS